MKTPKARPPMEDPKVKEARELEQARAEADRVKATQQQMTMETQQRRRGLGVSSLGGTLGTTGGRKSLLGA